MIELSIQLIHLSFLLTCLFEGNLIIKEYLTFTSFLLILLCIGIEYIFKITEISIMIVQLINSLNSKEKKNKLSKSKRKNIEDASSGSSHDLIRHHSDKNQKHQAHEFKLRLRRNNFIKPNESNSKSNQYYSNFFDN